MQITELPKRQASNGEFGGRLGTNLRVFGKTGTGCPVSPQEQKRIPKPRSRRHSPDFSKNQKAIVHQSNSISRFGFFYYLQYCILEG